MTNKSLPVCAMSYAGFIFKKENKRKGGGDSRD